MSKVYLLLLIILGFHLANTTLKGQGIGVNNDNSDPDPSAMLDIKASDRGVLLPRVALTSISDITTVPNSATSLMVYNTSNTFDLDPGYYFWSGSRWIPLDETWKTNAYNEVYTTSNIGINDATPDYPLDVVGNAFISGNLGIGLTPDYDVTASNAYIADYIGIGTTPTASYSIDVAGPVRVQNDMRVNGILNPNNALTIGNDVSVEGDLQVNTNKGIVRSNNSTQLKTIRTSVTLGANLGSGGFVDSGILNFEAFSAVPTIIVGQINTASSSGDWYKIQLIPFDANTSSVKFRLYNTASTSCNMTGSWQIFMIGPQ